jgi:hypothetical protein
LGEGWPKTVDIVVMPTIIAIATSRPCAMRAATTTTTTTAMRMTTTTTTMTTTTMMTAEGERRGQDNDGSSGGQPGVIHSNGQYPPPVKIPGDAPKKQASQGATKCTHFGLSPFNCLFLTCKLRQGHEKQPVLVELSCYVPFYVSILHLIFIVLVLKS